ncbi:mersacidin/lichenicidin family type 2 lantibiotic [Hyalangium rubrum]|uniref:Mersacidin/lichenicidin family type 2 lantibiotic n=1 Tax=Hyalangium rubrum TaxID=3103134 RepID=A0ABU5GYH0_9BACT|nr:mersacidin/lichenicidin family type 2 lantibiotic [Hyalangium sp. s54d21]MDY7226233.1 mersacidin/lichenicidin family type 2 lantibiotic [Hyalangium sp. s54d21]
MKRETVVRAWKDPAFRASLTPEERSALPECPAGTAFTELDDAELADAVGGALLFIEDGCMCTDWTVPFTTKTFTSVRINQLELVNPVVLDKAVLNTRGF